MISIRHVKKSFGKLQVLHDVNLEFASGNSYALMGPNGSGKTTLIKSILGMVMPDEGEILFNTRNIRGQWDYRKQIGYMPQIGRYPDNMRIGQLFDMMKNIRKDSFLTDEELITSFRLDALFDKRMHTLSGGTRQKVSAALAFLFDPAVLILDEPTAGLDPLSVEILKDKITKERERGKLILITSHVVSDLDDLTTDLVYLIEGQVRFHDTIACLKEITNETRLGKAVARLITKNPEKPVSVL
jgi:Cu-processing system ATP-binding protein